MAGKPPLGPEDAQRRVFQLEALTDPVSLLVLSRLAQSVQHTSDAHELAMVLDQSDGAMSARLTHLRKVGLVADTVGATDGRVTLSVEAWERFRRLIAPRMDRDDEPVGVPRVEPEVDWGAYPTVVHRISQQLAHRFRTTFSRHTVERYVADSYDELADRSHVQTHLPMLTNRLTTDRLGELAAARGVRLRPVPEVFFVCVRNSGRSQLATAILRHLAGELVSVSSAGTLPAAAVEASVLQVLDEVNVHEELQAPKKLNRQAILAADVVVTMGCGDACPIVPGRRYFDWPIADPARQPVEEVRRIRDEIWQRVEGLLSDLDIDSPPSNL